MKANAWDKGTLIDVERIGRCTAYRRTINGEFYQWKIKHGFTEAVGDYAISNVNAVNNALAELRKRFKKIFDD